MNFDDLLEAARAAGNERKVKELLASPCGDAARLRMARRAVAKGRLEDTPPLTPPPPCPPPPPP